MDESTSKERSATTDGNALPNRNPPDVTRFKAAAAKRVQAHRARARMGLRCLTVRVSDRIVRHLISTGYLSLESREAAAAVAVALEAGDIPNPSRLGRPAVLRVCVLPARPNGGDRRRAGPRGMPQGPPGPLRRLRARPRPGILWRSAHRVSRRPREPDAT
jgi:hypothetical protein